MTTPRQVTIAEGEGGQRLDRWFKRRFPALGHGRLEKLLRTGQVRLDGKRVKAGVRLRSGQALRVPPLAAEAQPHPIGPRRAETRRERPPPAEDLAWLEAAVLYRDDWVIALDKPAGLAVQGGSGQRRHLDAMLGALRFGAEETPRLVHRLDKDTSGVLLLARSREAARALTRAFRDTRAEKTYWALVASRPRKAVDLIDLPLAKLAGPEGERMGPVDAPQRPAVTLLAEAARTTNRGPAWLVLRPLTGRTHQLRVHCAALGHPILGDGKYGGREAFPKAGPRVARLQLHAREIALPHPEDGTTLRVAAPLPPDMAETWAACGFDQAEGEKTAERALSRYLDSLPKSRLAALLGGEGTA